MKYVVTIEYIYISVAIETYYQSISLKLYSTNIYIYNTLRIYIYINAAHI